MSTQGMQYRYLVYPLELVNQAQPRPHLLASNPGSSFRILSRSFGEKSQALRSGFCLAALEKNPFSPNLRDKIRNEEPGFEATHLHEQSTNHTSLIKQA